MATPLFTNPNCKFEFVPVVDFKFVDVCQIPELPPPIFDCASPPCPPFEPPPPCPTIEGGPVDVKVRQLRAGCPLDEPASGVVTVAKGVECEFNIGMALDIAIPVPPCPSFEAGKAKITAEYGSCEPSTGTVTITPKITEDPCADEECAFDIGLDLTLNIPPPPCPKITVSGTEDSSASTITGTGKNNPGNCGTPECDIEIVLTYPKIPTIPEITTTINTFFTTNPVVVNTSIATYLTTNIEEIVTNIIGPTINTYINAGGGGDNKTCIPKIKSGKINVTAGASPSGQIKVTDENAETSYCKYPNVVTTCCFGTPALGFAAFGFKTAISNLANYCGRPLLPDPYDCCISLGGTLSGSSDCSPVSDVCEDVSQIADAESYCADKSGRLVTPAECGKNKKCPDLKITADLTIPEAACIPTYMGGDIAVDISEDEDAEPKGEIKLGEPTKIRACEFPENSLGAALEIGLSAGAPAPKICATSDYAISNCAALGGTPKTTYDCAPSCDDKEITAKLTLPKELSKLKFKSGSGNLTSTGECTKPYITVDVKIDHSGKAGEYTIDVSGSFCSCCDGREGVVDNLDKSQTEEGNPPPAQ